MVKNNSGTFPALTLDTTTQIFMYYDAVMVINSVTTTMKDWKLTIDNKIDKERFLNSQTLTAVNSQDRKVLFETNVPWGDFSCPSTASDPVPAFRWSLPARPVIRS